MINFQYLFNLLRYIQKRFFIPYNRIKLRISGASVGANCRIFQGLYFLIKKGGTCKIGKNFTVQSGSNFNPLVRGNKASIYVGSQGGVNIGDNSGMSSSCIWCINSITIGNHVDIGANCVIIDNDAHSLDYRIRRTPSLDIANSAPIVIEDDVLIGTNSIVLKGVRIGARSIIGAGSVVTKDIPSDCIAAGNPCRVIKRINNE